MRKSIVALLVLSLPAGVVGVAALARAQQPEVREILQQIAQGVDRDIPRTDIRFRDETGVIRAGVRCAARPVSAFERALVSNATMDFVRATGTAHRDTTKTIPVVFHVVRKGKKYDVTDQQVSDSIDVLNAAYGDHGYTFVLQETRRSKNNQFAKKCLKRNQERKFKRANAIDPATTLNIYTCRPQLGILGYATFPSDYPEDSYFHGVVLLYSSVPDGGAVPYDEGDTLVHEVGHYLGLYHTFQDGCSGTGDEVDDTPEEDEPAYGCPVGRDTCLNAPGVDPVFNYMDYTDDACMDEFTPGQKTRMDDQVATFKPSLGTSTQN